MNRGNDSAMSLAGARAAETRWWASLALFVLVGAVAAIVYRGPSPRGLPLTVDVSASRPDGSASDAQQPSAARARQTLDRLLGEEQAVHKAGSRENQYVRVRLLSILDELDAETWVLPLSPLDGDGQRDDQKLGMANIVARIDGQPRVRPLVLASHYDSCPQGPGAGDAGQCVAAILETLRVLKSQPLQRELWCVFSDGEERGMWGAKDLVERDDLPWGEAKPLVINFDARGDQGAALLYETQVNNLQSMQIAAAALARPKVSTSLMVNIYQRLPNGTDFTPYRNSGWVGWNFAVIDGAERYHTADDTLENLSPRSLQHFASHAVNLVRRIDTLGDRQLASLGHSEPAVFFDLLGQWLVVYPAAWNGRQLAIASGIWLAAWFLPAYPRMRASRVLLTAVLIGAAIVVSGLAGWLIMQGLKAADVLPRRYINYGELICLLYPMAAALVVMALARALASRCSRTEVLAGLVLVLLVVGGLASRSLPGGAYLLLLPALSLAILLAIHNWRPLPEALDRRFGWLACALPALLYAPTYVLLAQALGATYGGVITAGVALMLLPTILAWAPTTTAVPHGT